ncbi:hypothetical protein [Arthrobacter koreensis]|nr:hypothetical protein [Arthrobacter koreensis]MEB7503574.1 hypothetical protein [Arthrobacter koreensis]
MSLRHSDEALLTAFDQGPLWFQLLMPQLAGDDVRSWKDKCARERSSG